MTENLIAHIVAAGLFGAVLGLTMNNYNIEILGDKEVQSKIARNQSICEQTYGGTYRLSEEHINDRYRIFDFCSFGPYTIKANYSYIDGHFRTSFSHVPDLFYKICLDKNGQLFADNDKTFCKTEDSMSEYLLIPPKVYN